MIKGSLSHQKIKIEFLFIIFLPKPVQPAAIVTLENSYH